MAFWSRKKKHQTAPVDEDLLRRLEESIRLSAESTDRATLSMSRSFHELTKALNKTTNELMRRK